jgi:hypothetical protein
MFLAVSSVLYLLSIKMHEKTIFKISGRVDFLDMPVLDNIENKTEQWYSPIISILDASNNVASEIMQYHYLQQQPLLINHYADHINLTSELVKLEKSEIEYTEMYKAANINLRKNVNKGKVVARLLIFDEVYYRNPNGLKSNMDKLFIDKDPMKEMLETTIVWHHKEQYNFRTFAVKDDANKMVCNIAHNADDQSVPLGAMDVAILDPLFIRNTYLSTKYLSLNATYSEVDMFQRDPNLQKFPNFEYEKVSHLSLKPGDCLYLPNQWWMQINFDKIERHVDDIDNPDTVTPGEKLESATVEWIEYSYPSISNLQDVAMWGIEEGYGS